MALLKLSSSTVDENSHTYWFPRPLSTWEGWGQTGDMFWGKECSESLGLEVKWNAIPNPVKTLELKVRNNFFPGELSNYNCNEC